ncbi:hypothetical protein JOD29_003098 [Lysinibacillus composti]|uniref:DUF3231 family protein n=1 Tax=Lysinibacillus composti TaxID=720633 RepID=A0A3N9UAR4_9BACI|nr:DUF3231 family protein [Lysinibacillus composti]MBM7609822.1 hypothetical protein [Lysinibacillus composti]RQW73594.1 DUF3231 family protein [Lysinibacillus composti]
MTEHHIQLTSAEIASIWTAYINDSMSKCVLGYFLKHVEDQEIRSIIQQSYNLASTHIEKLTSIFQKEQLPLPTGFTNEDVNLNAPRLYTDSFMLDYIGHTVRAGLLAYGGFIGMSARKDIRAYFMEALTETSNLYETGADISLSKGLFVRPPYIPYPTKTDFVDSKKYFTGLNPFNRKRPLNAVEISYLFMNIKTNNLGSKLALSFAQTASTGKVKKWMLRGSDTSKKHIQIFTQLLLDNDTPVPASSDVCITDSTTPPFSEKLIMYHMSLLSAIGMGNYATAAAASQRSDLAINYERLSIEIGQYAKDGADIMVQNEWLEQPPGTMDKEQLAKSKDRNR